MERRHFLAGVRIGVSTTSVGCLADSLPTDGSENGNKDNNKSRISDGTNEKTIKKDPRVTKPSYKIEQSDKPNNPEDFDEWNDEYLGEHMDTESSLTFETLSVPVGHVRDTSFTDVNSPNKGAYEVRVVQNMDDYKAVFHKDELYTVDFNEYMLLLVESGFGSGSVEHRWARMEVDGGIVNLYGYYTDPYEQTDDIDTWFSVLKVEQPSDDFEFARVSLTVDKKRRIHFNSTEGVVTLKE
ncbi:hypothetical protein [Natrinema sp. SYSU A 869]|uniref:hypothetical protein n=1 Tax=Natrinema sp. SYSU A 869 TaxID=2871694 RepID=UPI001CA3E13E|nr:hypothetical protein [Natrinema sp. SYSU A 869]